MTALPPFTGVIDSDLRRITAPLSPPPVIESAFIGEIRTENEYPTAKTIEKLYDQLDFQRACQAFLRNITASSMYSFRKVCGAIWEPPRRSTTFFGTGCSTPTRCC